MIDYAQILVKAGNGGNGKVNFHHEKNLFKGGPDGGDGGRGGAVFIETDKDLNTLKPFQFQKKFEAEFGAPGGKDKRHGRDGKELTIKVPIGTLVKFPQSNSESPLDLTQAGERVCLLRGGKGGRGNWQFRSSTTTTPKFAEKGMPGRSVALILELKLLADVGLIGLPNAGKSTLLSVLTKAQPKIAAYPFTTLEPNLGVLRMDPTSSRLRGVSDLVIADIPGLIEGASQGRGLGIEFLRHIERCRVLVHLLDGFKLLTQTPKALFRDYEAIRGELAQYSSSLLEKPEIIVLNKIDVLTKKQIKAALTALRKANKKVVAISAASHENLDELKNALMKV